eukprot:m.69855 g.69855  ORF g.69855 m.69855 type:complete len:51 (+) comp35642_c0_seq1:141-293(+)
MASFASLWYTDEILLFLGVYHLQSMKTRYIDWLKRRHFRIPELVFLSVGI